MSTPVFDPVTRCMFCASACSLVIPQCHWPLAMLFNFTAWLKIKPSLPSHLRPACLCGLCVAFVCDQPSHTQSSYLQHRPTSWTKRRPALLSSHTCSEALTPDDDHPSSPELHRASPSLTTYRDFSVGQWKSHQRDKNAPTQCLFMASSWWGKQTTGGTFVKPGFKTHFTPLFYSVYWEEPHNIKGTGI